MQKKREKILGGGVPPPVFCKRVRKLLTRKELSKHSFLKSAEEFENRGVIFSLFLQKSERGEARRKAEHRGTEFAEASGRWNSGGREWKIGKWEGMARAKPFEAQGKHGEW
jgi:hypothetical protein